MTSNPLARRRMEPDDYAPRPYRTMQEHVDYLNATCTRPDLEWAVGDNAPYLRDKLHLSARRTRELDQKAEQSRNAWKRAQPRTINEEK